MNFDLGTGTDRNYNIGSIALVVLSLLTCIITLFILLFGGGGGSDFESQAVPTSIEFPTATETLIPTITRTPLPATFTPTFTRTPTARATSTGEPTATPTTTSSPTPTITTTVLPSATPTETETPAPTLGTPPPSPSPFLFALSGEVTYITNLNASGCAWQGIGGQVLGVDGQSASNLNVIVSVAGGGLPQALTTTNNTNTLYGAGGYEIQLANAINTQSYFVQLVTEFGTPVSDLITVTFDGTCEGNAAIVNFQQTRNN